MFETIRNIIEKHGSLAGPVSAIADDADLYEAGLSSFASVQVMLALEDAFEVEFPETLLNRKSFSSISAIAAAVGTLLPEAAQ